MNQIRLGKYRHFKGNEYRVIGIAKHSETLEEMVVYQALYGEYGLWVRPLSMFLETVERDGKSVQRFTYIGEDES
jgi:cyclomaltodextrinase